MRRDHDLLFVVADGEDARFLRLAADNALHTQTYMNSPEAHLRSKDLGSGRPGATFHSDSTAHHAVAPRHDLHELAKGDFARDLAGRLNAAADKGFSRNWCWSRPHTR